MSNISYSHSHVVSYFTVERTPQLASFNYAPNYGATRMSKVISKLDSTVRKHRTTLILCHRLISLKNTFIKKIGSHQFESLIL